MLVEDDNNLREIYQARLNSEGYETVTASDGEEALSIVGREKPDLIILDVMMPKISGFDTLDLLKNSPVTKDIKVIMMTALSQAEDRARAEKLGAQNYLVKSQVTLEDIVKAVKDAISGVDAYSAEAPSNSAQATTTSVFNSAPVEQPVPTTNDSMVTPTAEPSLTEPQPSEMVSPQIPSEAPIENPVVNPTDAMNVEHVDNPMAQQETAPDNMATAVDFNSAPIEQPAPVTNEAMVAPIAEPSLPEAQPAEMFSPPAPIETPIVNPTDAMNVEHVDNPMTPQEATTPDNITAPLNTDSNQPIAQSEQINTNTQI